MVKKQLDCDKYLPEFIDDFNILGGFRDLVVRPEASILPPPSEETGSFGRVGKDCHI